MNNESGLIKQSGRDVKYVLALRELATDKSALVAHIKARPNDVLSVIKDGREYGITDRESADILEEVFGAYQEPDTALLFMDNNKFSLARMSELLVARDDLDSLAAENMPFEVVIDVILAVLVRGAENNLSSYWSRGIPMWCRKIKERSDYGQILNTKITKRFKVHDLLLLAIWHISDMEDSADVPPQCFVDFNLEVDESRSDLIELAQEVSNPKTFSLLVNRLEQRRQRWAEKYQLQAQDATTTLAKERAQEL